MPLEPDEVFTPNGFPVEDENVYAAREHAEAALKEGFARRQVPVVHGEYGVGKTTLAKRYFRREDREGRFVHVWTIAGKNLDDVVKIALEHLGYEVEVGREQRRDVSLEGSVEGGVWFALRARLAGKASEGKTAKTELFVQTPTDQGFLRVLADARVIIALDEMHKANEGFRAQLAELIKAASNQGRRYPRFIVLGTTADAGDLVLRDPGIDRLVREVGVAPMTDDEAGFVVRDGMRRLEIDVSDDLVGLIVRTVAGAPALLQELCLDVAVRIRDQGRSAVEQGDVEAAVRKFLLNSQARLTARYMLAVNTIGTLRYRQRILLAMAEHAGDFITMEELTRAVSAQVGKSVPAQTLSGPLRDLKTAQYGEILTDVERPDTGGHRAHNLTAFKDPRMKAFIRAMHAVESQGMLPSRQEVAALPVPTD